MKRPPTHTLERDPIEDLKHGVDRLKKVSKSTKKKAWDVVEALARHRLVKIFSPEAIHAGFKRSGIVPFDPYRILQRVPAKFTDEERVGMAAAVTEILDMARSLHSCHR